jgi:ABC-type nickel/cobalt efflux system permease component RcnA
MVALVLLPGLALAHPLGNFTINHYAGVRIQPGSVLVDAVLDEAEIPTFQERLRLDTNADGALSPDEIEAARVPECRSYAASLALVAGGVSVPLQLDDAALSFPPGAANLVTMRVVCELRGALPVPIGAGTRMTFTDSSFPDRIGWREVVVQGDGTTISGAGYLSATRSERLTSYPQDLLSQPLDMTGPISFSVSPGGPTLAPFVAPELRLAAAASRQSGASGGALGASSTGSGSGSSVAAAVPGGIGTEVTGLLGTRDLTPLVVLLSLGTALLLGAGHALTPGHGKTVMAAYLVGTRGTAVQALGLGLAVTVSHTVGIVVLAAVIIALGSALPPETFQRAASMVSALIVLAIGGWLVGRQLRARLADRSAALRPAAREHPDAAWRAHGHGDEPGGAHDHAQDHGQAHGHGQPGVHSHGGVAHSHLPATDRPITWRSLAVLGLAGGIIPSANALLILLATIATGRAAYGLVLVVAFGVGMALVMGGVGLALVFARDRVERVPNRPTLARIAAIAPAATAVFVLALGLYLTSQAIVGSPTF